MSAKTSKKHPDFDWLAAANAPDATPMMAQFMTIKADHQDCLLFYRMGDFYELFFGDAEQASAALDITLTKRGKHSGDDIPMAGVPVHAAEMYLSRLIRKGFKVAVCEQTEDPADAKKRGAKAVVKREVIRLVTPGTLTEDSLLDARSSNYLAAIGKARRQLSIAVADVSAGTFFILPTSVGTLDADLARLKPGEIVIPEGLTLMDGMSDILFDWREQITPRASSRFDSNRGSKRLKEIFSIATTDGLADFDRADLSAIAGLLDYIDDTQKGKMPRLKVPARLDHSANMMIDAPTRRSLELTHTQTGATSGSLLSVIDRTVTGAGARLLAAHLSAPLTDPASINARLDGVSFFVSHPSERSETRQTLKRAPDLERALGRLALGRGGPRDLGAVRDGLLSARTLKGILTGRSEVFDRMPESICASSEGLGSHDQIIDELSSALMADLPMITRDGGYIAKGYDASLDNFRMLRDESRRLIAGLESDYREKTGVSTLKVKHNNVIGYHVDVTARHADKFLEAPLNDLFIHRQTLANSVRFSTTELAGLAAKISEAGERSLALELEIFEKLSAVVMGSADAVSTAAVAIAKLDVAASSAELAEAERWCRPIIDNSLDFDIQNGRHPAVEAALASSDAGGFVANDCNLGGDGRLWLITGPNMAGKSTFLRQNALIAILAQMGFYVPASSAKIGTVDRLFSRVGASDDLAHGRSTFMVEMVETAAILNQAGERSLVILDEIGRGTATYDGLSIAWAAVENLHEVNRSRALFATHYHELTSLRETLDHMTLRSMKVREWEGDVIFLHEVVEGAADRSYGIQVAKLAGLPAQVIDRARAVLDSLENSPTKTSAVSLVQDLPLFQTLQAEKTHNPASGPSPVEEKLAEINPDMLTPKEALDILYSLKDASQT